MSLKERITDDMKAAMRSGEKERLGAIRMITAAIKQREVDERITLDDTQVISVLEKMIKQRKESVTLFLAGKLGLDAQFTPGIAAYWAGLSARPGYLRARAAQTAALAAQGLPPTDFLETIPCLA